MSTLRYICDNNAKMWFLKLALKSVSATQACGRLVVSEGYIITFCRQHHRLDLGSATIFSTREYAHNTTYLKLY